MCAETAVARSNSRYAAVHQYVPVAVTFAGPSMLDGDHMRARDLCCSARMRHVFAHHYIPLSQAAAIDYSSVSPDVRTSVLTAIDALGSRLRLLLEGIDPCSLQVWLTVVQAASVRRSRRSRHRLLQFAVCFHSVSRRACQQQLSLPPHLYALLWDSASFALCVLESEEYGRRASP